MCQICCLMLFEDDAVQLKAHFHRVLGITIVGRSHFTHIQRISQFINTYAYTRIGGVGIPPYPTGGNIKDKEQLEIHRTLQETAWPSNLALHAGGAASARADVITSALTCACSPSLRAWKERCSATSCTRLNSATSKSQKTIMSFHLTKHVNKMWSSSMLSMFSPTTIIYPFPCCSFASKITA